MPLYDWKNLYTTNYDELIENAYTLNGRNLLVYASNFDFTVRGHPTDTRLFKLHGTISHDTSDGHTARLIITTQDYDYSEEYRQKLFDNFKADLSDSNLIMIGHSLADQDIKDIY